MTVMAILQDVDKCMRCNGCVISCKRTWEMKALNPGIHKTAPDQRVIIKSQKRVDMGPFMRFSCWHCENPPCIQHCPFEAIQKDYDPATGLGSGAVFIDPTLCKPNQFNADGVQCIGQCQIDCGRGGYPKIGKGSDQAAYADQTKAWKCTMCYGRAGDVAAVPDAVAKYGNPLPSNYNTVLGTGVAFKSVAEQDHEPSCVYTCPAKAMKYDTRANVLAHLVPANGYISAQGDGSVFWASKKNLVIAPKADPFVEDHVTPLVSSVLSSPFAKAALVPMALGAGLLALIARRQQLADESMGEV